MQINDILSKHCSPLHLPGNC